MERTLAAAPSSVSAARHEVAAYLQNLGITDQDIEIAVTEAVSNAVGHGFRGGRRGSICLRIEMLVPDTLVVTITDDGVGLQPDLENEGLGLGFSLIGRFAKDFEIREAAPYGTVIAMRFPLPEQKRRMTRRHG